MYTNSDRRSKLSMSSSSSRTSSEARVLFKDLNIFGGKVCSTLAVLTLATELTT